MPVRSVTRRSCRGTRISSKTKIISTSIYNGNSLSNVSARPIRLSVETISSPRPTNTSWRMLRRPINSFNRHWWNYIDNTSCAIWRSISYWSSSSNIFSSLRHNTFFSWFSMSSNSPTPISRYASFPTSLILCTTAPINRWCFAISSSYSLD